MENFNTQTIGVFKRDELWTDWWISNKVAVPFFDNKKVLIIFIDKNQRQIDRVRLTQLDKRLGFFFSLGQFERKSISNLVHKFCYQHCIRKDMNCSWYEDKSGVWDFISPTTVCFVGKKQGIDIVVNCDCRFIKCNGIQLRFSEGIKLPLINEVKSF